MEYKYLQTCVDAAPGCNGLMGSAADALFCCVSLRPFVLSATGTTRAGLLCCTRGLLFMADCTFVFCTTKLHSSDRSDTVSISLKSISSAMFRRAEHLARHCCCPVPYAGVGLHVTRNVPAAAGRYLDPMVRPQLPAVLWV